MKLRILCLGLMAGCTLGSLSGCETTHPFSRKQNSDTTSVKSPVPVEDGNEEHAVAGPKGFFKPTRLSGALSSEGADIEHDLGVH